jgi:hypothetical protein
MVKETWHGPRHWLQAVIDGWQDLVVVGKEEAKERVKSIQSHTMN